MRGRSIRVCPLARSPRGDGRGEGEGEDLAGPGDEQGLGGGLEGTARRQDVVDEGDARIGARQAADDAEGALQGPAALGGGEAGLGAGIPDPDEQTRGEGTA